MNIHPAAGLLLVVCQFAWTAATAQIADRPKRETDDTWNYRFRDGPWEYTLTQKITGVLAERYLIEVIKTDSKTGVPAITKGRWSIDGNAYARASPEDKLQEVLRWRWPMAPGAKWTYEVPNPRGNEVWEVQVGEWEEVSVPAGRFRALPVRRDLVRNPDPLYGAQHFQWYSPEAKGVVKSKFYSFYEASTRLANEVGELESVKLH